jgi:hypothetical protein
LPFEVIARIGDLGVGITAAATVLSLLNYQARIACRNLFLWLAFSVNSMKRLRQETRSSCVDVAVSRRLFERNIVKLLDSLIFASA